VIGENVGANIGPQTQSSSAVEAQYEAAVAKTSQSVCQLVIHYTEKKEIFISF
jgi:hypothetical protein